MTVNVKQGPQARDDFASGSEHQLLSIDVLENDGANSAELWSLDQDNLALLTDDGTPVLLASGATVWFEDGELQYDPGEAFNHLSAGETATDQFMYAIRMGNGSVSWATVTVTIAGEDDPVAGVVTDGYIAGATVFIDVNENGVLDTGEPNTISDANGDFTITPSASGPLIAIGGTNIDTGLSNQLTLKAPQGSTVINPLTSLIQALVATGLDATEAERQMQAALGLTLGVSLLSYDILAQPPGDPDALEAQKAAASIAAILNTSSIAAGAQSQQAVLEQLAAAVNAADAAGTTLVLTETATIEAILAPALPPGTDVASLSASIALATSAIQNATTIEEIAAIQVNTITGTEGDDVIAAPAGESTLLGLGGNDTFTIGQLAGITATINGGTGSDLLLLAGSWPSDWRFEPVNESTIRGIAVDGTTIIFSEIETVSISGVTSLPVRSTEAGQEVFGTHLTDYIVALHAGVTIDGTSPGNDQLVPWLPDTTTIILSWSESSVGANFHGTDSSTHFAIGADGGTKTISPQGNSYNVVITGSDYDDVFEVEVGSNQISAGAGNDHLGHGASADTLDGGSGNDWLFGYGGADSLTGGTGADTFYYAFASDSSSLFGIDTIHDFESGIDLIQLDAIDADTNTDGNQAFSFVGHQQFSGTAGELRFESHNGDTLIEGDVDGDGVADFQLILVGNLNLDPTDFWL